MISARQRTLPGSVFSPPQSYGIPLIATYAEVVLATWKRYCPGGKSAVSKPLAVKGVAAVSQVDSSAANICSVTEPDSQVATTDIPYLPPARLNTSVSAEIFMNVWVSQLVTRNLPVAAIFRRSTI